MYNPKLGVRRKMWEEIDFVTIQPTKNKLVDPDCDVIDTSDYFTDKK